MAEILIPIPDPNGIKTNGEPNMASQHAERYDDLTLQVELRAKDSGNIYQDDARRAYQRRMDTVSMAESVATQQLNTSRIAQEIAQLRAGVSQPPIVVNSTEK